MIVGINGWRFDTEDVRGIRYRYSLKRLILQFEDRTVEIEMLQNLAEAYTALIVSGWETDKRA